MYRCGGWKWCYCECYKCWSLPTVCEMFFACRFVVHNSLWFWQLPSGREAYQTNVPLTACIIRLHLVCSWNLLPFPCWTGKLTLHFKPTGNPAPAMLYFHADSFKCKIHLFFSILQLTKSSMTLFQCLEGSDCRGHRTPSDHTGWINCCVTVLVFP